MKRHCFALGLVVFLCTAPSPAQEILLTGPWKAAPVGRKLWREGRVELAAALGLRASHAENPIPLLIGELRYYPWERLALGVWGATTPLFNDGCSR